MSVIQYKPRRAQSGMLAVFTYWAHTSIQEVLHKDSIKHAKPGIRNSCVNSSKWLLRHFPTRQLVGNYIVGCDRPL